jgi:glycosyltransferase involved in cell wall biosynthesis
MRVYGFKSFDPSKSQYRKRSPLPIRDFTPGKTYDIVFDAQCLQTSIRQRGIGTYSLNFISAICNERPRYSFAAVLTTTASAADLTLAEAALKNLQCSNLDILILSPFKSKQKVSLHAAHAELRSALESTHCRAVIALSSFEKQDSIITLPRSSRYKQIAIVYDLIRLQFPSDLLFSTQQRTSFAWSLNNLTKCDLLLSISQETKRHWTDLVSPGSHIKVIYGGATKAENLNHKGFKERSGVLCIGGEEPHKNLKRLIEAYSQLPEEVQLRHSLTIVGIRSIGVRGQLFRFAKRAKGRVSITDYLVASQLTELYENARLLVVPSLVEGLSLPILEAWAHGLVAVGSANTVAQELIENVSQLFDPFRQESLAACMQDMLISPTSWNEALESAMFRSELFSWNATANLALNAIEELIRD